MRTAVGEERLRTALKRVDEAGIGHDAYALIEAQDLDLALVDVRMPGMDGLALLDRSLDVRPEMPVVVITGRGTIEIVIDVLRRGGRAACGTFGSPV